MEGPDGGAIFANGGDWRRFGFSLVTFEILMVVLFMNFVEYEQAAFDDAQVIQYSYFLDVSIMMLVGFGFLMTFMRKYGLGAVGLTFMVTTCCIPWCILTGRFFATLAGSTADYPNSVSPEGADGQWFPQVQLDINALLNGNFAAAAILISLGAVIGKLSPSQVALLAILEVPIYSFSKEFVCVAKFGTLDMGGTIFIHLFGAYFGLAAAWVFGKPHDDSADHAEPSETSDLFSLLGTVFLWIYWPSFNGATAPIGQNQQQVTIANTVCALCASCMTTFVFSAYYNKRLNTVDIQNATLAGGVAIGASSNLLVTPAGAMAVGMVAGAVSTTGFNKLQSWVEDNLGIHDSCGVHNLHGMPALIGSLAVTIATSIPSAKPSTVVYTAVGMSQPAAQLAGAGFTLVVAVVGGAVSACIVRALLPSDPKARHFVDGPYWTTAKTICD
jgi:ammonium transporter Rh